MTTINHSLSVQFLLSVIRKLHFISQPNLFFFKKILDDSQNKVFQKSWFDIFHITIFNISNITLIVIPSTFKMVFGIAYT